MKYRFALGLATWMMIFSTAIAADHRVEVANGPAPADQLSAAIAAQLAPTGLKVIRGTSRAVCEIWFCKEVPVEKGFQPSRAVNYPFQQGQLIGVVRYARRGADFRDQDVGKGVYTMRYAQQPVDGNHEGTSPTRDFLLLVLAETDRSIAPIEVETLLKQSADAIESTHPAMLSLQKVRGGATSKPAMRHNEQHDWWILQFPCTVKAGDQTQVVPIELVVVGAAEE